MAISSLLARPLAQTLQTPIDTLKVALPSEIMMVAVLQTE